MLASNLSPWLSFHFQRITSFDRGELPTALAADVTPGSSETEEWHIDFQREKQCPEKTFIQEIPDYGGFLQCVHVFNFQGKFCCAIHYWHYTLSNWNKDSLMAHQWWCLREFLQLFFATLEDFLQGLKTGTRKLCRGIATGTMLHALFVGRFLGFERPNWF